MTGSGRFQPARSLARATTRELRNVGRLAHVSSPSGCVPSLACAPSAWSLSRTLRVARSPSHSALCPNRLCSVARYVRSQLGLKLRERVADYRAFEPIHVYLLIGKRIATALLQPGR